MAHFLFWFGFFAGALAALALEAWILLMVLDRLRRRSEQPQPSDPASVRDFSFGEESLASALTKQGIVWVLEPEKVPKINVNVSPARDSKELKSKKTIVEVYPAKKYAKIKDHKLILSGSDGSYTTIELLDCTVVAVSASDMYTRKWAKRYPIILETKNSTLYKGSKTCYIYFETCWEKETWCKALRLASCPDREKLNWFVQLTEEFHQYIAFLAAEYPSFLKPPPALLSEAPDQTNRIDVSTSRVRGFLRKFSKKASKNSAESKVGSVSSSFHGERRIGDRIRSLRDVASTDVSVKGSPRHSSDKSLQDLVQSPTSSMIRALNDSVSNEKIVNDDGTLCWNLLFSRLFFDARRSTGLNDAIKARIQRTLSNMRTPSYIGNITLTSLDLGDLPPYIHKMRVLPMDLNEVWAVEVDIEYSGGIILDVETRIEAYEQEKDNVDKSPGLASAEDSTSDLFEGVDLSRVPSNSSEQMENRDDGYKVDGLKQSKKWTLNYATRWKAAVHSIANKVSQVPLSLAIRIASLRGTLRIHIKPPPSDQLWCGFTSMPDIEWDLDSSVGDQKITSTHVALLIGNRFKAAIRDTLVLPNCENICIPWMLAEKDDWVPRNVAPFIWINQETMDTTGLDPTSSDRMECKPKLDVSTGGKTDVILDPDDKVDKTKNVVHVQNPAEDCQISATVVQSGLPRSISSSASQIGPHRPLFSNLSFDSSQIEELKQPLLRTDERQESSHSLWKAESPKTSTSSGESLDQSIVLVEEEAKSKKMGSRRARMMDLGKRMGEKLEEKRRILEERSRHVVGKMRENSRT